jgi:hypothetical protein
VRFAAFFWGEDRGFNKRGKDPIREEYSRRMFKVAKLWNVMVAGRSQAPLTLPRYKVSNARLIDS